MATVSQRFLPISTYLTGTGVFAIGLYSLLRPSLSAAQYGIPVPVAKKTSPALPVTENTDRERETSAATSLIYAHGVRNLSVGFSAIVLTAYWQRADVLARPVARRPLGLVLLCGGLIPVGDAIIVTKAGYEGGRRAAIIHVIRSVVWLGFGLHCFINA